MAEEIVDAMTVKVADATAVKSSFGILSSIACVAIETDVAVNNWGSTQTEDSSKSYIARINSKESDGESRRFLHL